MFQIHDSIEGVARQYGIPPHLLASKRLDLSTPGGVARARDAVAGAGRRDALHAAGMTEAKQVKDAATAFTTSALNELLAPVYMPGRERYLFVPGRTNGAPLLPVINRVALGKQQVEWPVIALTGEARAIAAGGLASLTTVGATEDMRKQPVFMYGVRMGWDQFELWQAAHLNRDVPSERQRAARDAMDSFAENVYSFGHAERECPGFFNCGGSTTVNLAKSFGDATITAPEMIEQLSIMDLMWDRLNPTRAVTGVVMPKEHRLNLLSKFTGANGEGDINAWKFALEMFPWLASVIEDARMLTASPASGPMWQMYSADGEELYAEGSPAPMMYGPFEDELKLSFLAIAQTGGVVSKNNRRIMRWIQPA